MRLPIMLAVPALLLSAGAASAQITVSSSPGEEPGVKTETATVPYGDLNLRTADGRITLDNRVTTAIDRICGDRPLAVEVRQQQQFSECRQQVASSANQEVAALYSNQGVMTARLDVPAWPGR